MGRLVSRTSLHAEQYLWAAVTARLKHRLEKSATTGRMPMARRAILARRRASACLESRLPEFASCQTIPLRRRPRAPVARS